MYFCDDVLLICQRKRGLFHYVDCDSLDSFNGSSVILMQLGMLLFNWSVSYQWRGEDFD